MSKSDRNGNSARGFIVGILATTLFFVLMGVLPFSVDVSAQSVANCSTASNDCANNNEGMPERWYWFRRFFALEDTVAQWVMMAFTIAAAGLLFATLRATQSMANDARGIGASQTRPYITAEGVAGNIVDDCYVGWIKFNNSGQTPASVVGFSFAHTLGVDPVRVPAFKSLECKPFTSVMSRHRTNTIGGIEANEKATLEWRQGKPIFVYGAIFYRWPNGNEIFCSEFGYKITVKRETGIDSESVNVEFVSDEISGFCAVDQDCVSYEQRNQYL